MDVDDDDNDDDGDDDEEVVVKVVVLVLAVKAAAVLEEQRSSGAATGRRRRRRGEPSKLALNAVGFLYRSCRPKSISISTAIPSLQQMQSSIVKHARSQRPFLAANTPH